MFQLSTNNEGGCGGHYSRFSMYCQVKLNTHQSDYSHYSKKFKIHYLLEFVIII